MADGWRITVDDRDAQRRLRIIEAGVRDLSSFWPTVAVLVRGWWKEMFKTEGAFAGTPWRPLSPAYAAWKATRYPGRGILQATGQMRQAASRPQRFQTPTTLTLTIDDPKLEFHQTGGGRLPARPLIFGDPLPPVAALQLDRAAEDYIRDLLLRA